MGILAAGSSAGTAFGVVLGVGLTILALIAYWRLFVKIGLPGWMGIVPFVNVYMIYKARGSRSPVLWLILTLIPCISIIAYWFVANDTAEIFGKHLGWKLLLFFIPGISHLVLAFGSAEVDRAHVAPGVGVNAGVR